MTEVVRIIGITEANIIVDKIMVRQAKFNEELGMSIAVVLLNYGDGEVQVKCVGNEWAGSKKDLTPRNGIPLCPNGHPLFELSDAPKLALIK